MAAFGDEPLAGRSVLEELKAKAKAEGLWNLFLRPTPITTRGISGRGPDQPRIRDVLRSRWAKVSFGSEVFNCSAPDTGNMEVLHRYGTRSRRTNGCGR